MRKSIYKQVASIINHELRKHDKDDFKPRVSVVSTEGMGFGFGKWSLYVNNEANALIQNHKGKAQDMFYADEIYVVEGISRDLYIEPINSRYFGLAVL